MNTSKSLDASKPLEVISLDEFTEDLKKLINEKAEALNTVNIAVNEYVTLKNKYATSSNKLRISTDFKEAMNLSKAASEKQQQAYIDDKLQDLLQDIRIADENVKSWKREVDLLNDKISLEKYRLNLLREVIHWSQ